MADARERPILFSGPMVRVILDGHKTQTRRVVVPQPFRTKIAGDPPFWSWRKGKRLFLDSVHSVWPNSLLRHCPYGQPGDRLWAQETWAWEDDGRIIWRADRGASHSEGEGPGRPRALIGTPFYVASAYEPARWRPSIHMPRWASRLTLEVTDVRVERVQGISEEDAKAEGLSGWSESPRVQMIRYGIDLGDASETDPRRKFQSLWDSINAKRGYGWDVNPWVWVLTFKPLAAALGAVGGEDGQ